MEKFEHDDDIKIPNEFGNRIDMSLKKAKRGSYYYRNKGKIGTSLVLAFVLFLGMNPDVRAYTKTVMEWFKSDKSITELKENKFKIYDLVTEKDGYKLYMKDMYFDEGRFSMKIAVEDENGNAFDIQEGDITGNYISTRFGAVNGENIKNVDPWYDVRGFWHLRNVFDKENLNYGKVELKFITTVSDGNKTIEFDKVTIKEENISRAKSKDFKLEKEYQFNGVKIQVHDLKIYPNRMYVWITSKDSDIDSKLMFMKIKLIDENGNVYENYSEVFWGENSREFYFNDSIYFDEGNKIAKIEIDLGHGEVESMMIVPRKKLDYGETEEFKYNDKSFKTYREKDNKLVEYWTTSNENGYFKSEFREEDAEYTYLKLNDDVDEILSKYYIKKWTGIWEPMYNNIDEEIKTVRITKNEIDRQIGMELEDILKLNDDEFNDYGIKFNKYINYRLERNDSEINIDETRKTMERYIDCGQLFLGKSVSMKDPLTFRKETVSTKKDWEFGILDGSKIKTEHIELELD